MATEVLNAGSTYETIAASVTDQVMGITGKAGDYFELLVIVPATTAPGAVSIKDGSGSAITVFTGSATYEASLKPISVDLRARSTGGAWKVTTGANVSAIAVGRFTD
jgi:hypothetical protein